MVGPETGLTAINAALALAAWLHHHLSHDAPETEGQRGDDDAEVNGESNRLSRINQISQFGRISRLN